jgi:hypothetical protein
VIGICGKKSWGRKIILSIGFIAGCSAAVLAADAIKGVARNQTRGRFAAGADVILFRLDQTGLNPRSSQRLRSRQDSKRPERRR